MMGSRIALEALSDAQLEHLEALLIRNDGLPVEEWPDGDLRFVAGLRIVGEEERCAV